MYYNNEVYTEEMFVESNDKLKTKLQRKLNPQYKKEMADNMNVHLRPIFKNSNIKNLTPNHIEFIALMFLDSYFKNPYLVNKEIEDALDTPVDITGQMLTHYALLNLIGITNFNKEDNGEF